MPGACTAPARTGIAQVIHQRFFSHSDRKRQ